ncbi:MAG: ribosomal protein S18-alanine N-acetyltransferase [Pyrinomonadaceae bacterium]|nr:ribosomal protein S18-alanine N-acetyltransferase [Pyrinomonadaceae bacterium]MCX7641001.1 ribosomal protein S18-alanine N-acetyltransferase [Pyrinomonadaceae bacterium]MDW8305075.1 ribosomal protein S18-alanine N-acetyltransferase [Acidobacteriota bacterium]
MLVRRACSEDIEEIIEIEKSRGLGWGSYEDVFSNCFASLWVCKSEHVLGFISFRFLADEVEILSFAVRKEVEGTGVGKKLFYSCVSEAVMKNAKSIWLEVRKSNQRAIDFYLSQGFKLVKVRKEFYSFPPEDALLMKLDLTI